METGGSGEESPERKDRKGDIDAIKLQSPEQNRVPVLIVIPRVDFISGL